MPWAHSTDKVMEYLVERGWGDTSEGANMEKKGPKVRVGFLEKRDESRLITPMRNWAHLSLVLRPLTG